MVEIGSILLIDDSESVNSRNYSLLGSMKLFGEIKAYSNPYQAIKHLEKDFNKSNLDLLPSIIFLDIEMPEMDAFDFLNKYLDIESIVLSNYKPRIVIVSNYLLKDRYLDETNKYKTYGVIGHIRKPIDKADILDLLEENFGK